MTENKYDLTDFISNKETLLISDFEGTTPTAHFKKFETYCKTKQVIFLGDVFDNTAQYGPDNKCNGDVCSDPDIKLTCPTDENFCALRTIKLLVDNKDRCRYVFGNRDINKIKLLPFFSLEGAEKWWTVGNNYAEIVKNLLTNIEIGTYKWLINGNNVKYFRPFWKKDKEDYGRNLTWTKDNPPDMNEIYDRFELMFGKDASTGTMSALVSLKCIPNEVIGSDNMDQFYTDVTDKEKIDTFERKKIRAALTITIFMRMLDETLWKGSKEKSVHDFKALDGYLYHYLHTAPAAYYADVKNNGKNNLFLFAHGGITEDFVKKNGEGQFIEGDIKIWENQVENTEEIKKKFDKKGGDNEGNKIIDSIKFYNIKCNNFLSQFFKYFLNYKTVLNRVKNDNNFKDDKSIKKFNEAYIKKINEWIIPMLSLLDISAGVKQNPNQVKEPSADILDDYAADYDKVYNVFGHASSSAGYSFSKVKNLIDKKKKLELKKNNKTYYINTDFSTTLYKEGIACNEKYNENFLIAILDTTEPELKLTMEGKVILNKYIQAKEKKAEVEEAEAEEAEVEEAEEKEAKEKEAKEKEEPINNETITNYIENNKAEKSIEIVKNGNTEQQKIPAKKVYFFEDINDTLFDGTYEFDKSVNILDKLDDMSKPLECDFNGFAKINGKSYYAFSSIYRTVKGLHLIYFRPVKVQGKGEEVPPSEGDPLTGDVEGPLTGDVEGPLPAEGGRRRRKHNKRTRKHRLTKRIKLGKGKRKTKKHSKKTKRRRRM